MRSLEFEEPDDYSPDVPSSLEDHLLNLATDCINAKSHQSYIDTFVIFITKSIPPYIFTRIKRSSSREKWP